MQQINCKDKRVRIEGLYRFYETGQFRRYTNEIIQKYPRLAAFDKRSTGARMRFRTDSEKIRVEITVSNRFVDMGMSFFQANAGYIFTGDYASSKYAAIMIAPDTYDSETVSAEITNGGMNDVTVFFPRNPTVEDVNVFIEDGAFIGPPTPHKTALPLVFYGSSITEQGHTSTPFAYASLMSRFFDADYYNFGASGNACGEPEIAVYLGGIPNSVFFYDYDHNAPTAAYLQNTHEAFFKAFRSVDAKTPVIMTSRPLDDGCETAERKEIVKNTYGNAVAAGDKHVYYIDGLTLFGSVDPALCTSDRTHPNDLGHYLIADTLAEYIKKNNILSTFISR